MEELIHRIALRDVPGLDRARAWELLRSHGSARAVFENRAHPALERGPDLAHARAELQTCQRLGVRVLAPQAPEFPAPLRCIPDAPLLLYLRGCIPPGTALAIVGSRRPSARGRSAARRLAAELAGAGALIVSGLAFGVDAAAHEGALEVAGATLAVLASGLDEASPRGNRRLAARILDSGGGWLSEHPPGSPPLPRRFPERNRLISGLAALTLVVEARERSGSLWTARHALEQGRDVAVAPGPIDSAQCRGSNGLLRDGAIPILDGEDLLQAALGLSRRRPQARSTLLPKLPAASSEDARRVVALLADGPCDLDRLAALAGLSSARLAGVLLELELARAVSRQGRRIALEQ